MTLAISIISLITLGITLYLEIKRRSPEDEQGKWVLEFFKKRQIKRHKDIKEGNTDELSKDLADKVSNIEALLKDE